MFFSYLGLHRRIFETGRVVDKIHSSIREGQALSPFRNGGLQDGEESRFEVLLRLPHFFEMSI